MSYRDDLDALAARQAVLEAELAAKVGERDETERLLRDARKRRLPVLEDDLRIATECAADWNLMRGDDRVRRCGDCNQNVYNFSAMTRAEAEAVIVEHEGRMCSRFYRRVDGTILLRDCQITPRRAGWFAAGAAAAAVAGAGLWFGRSVPEPEPRDDSHLALPPSLRTPPPAVAFPVPHRTPPQVAHPVSEPVYVTQGLPPSPDLFDTRAIPTPRHPVHGSKKPRR